MTQSLGLDSGGRRAASLLSGAGMAFFSLLTIRHFFAANYPESIWDGSFCDISAFLNCDSSAFSTIAAVGGVPIGLFGLMLGGLVMIGAFFPSPRLECTNRTLALANGVGVVALAAYSVFVLGSLCLLCTGYYAFSLTSLYLFWRYGDAEGESTLAGRWLRPSVTILVVFSAITLGEGYGLAMYHEARREAQSGGVAVRIVRQFYELPEVAWPSKISRYWTARSTEGFEDAPIRIVEFGDLLCPDCRYLNEQLVRLKEEFAGKLNVVFQFFPLDAACNEVVEKDKHPGACDLSYMAAYDPMKFQAIHDEVFANMDSAKQPAWRNELARRHGVAAALTDSATIADVRAQIRTGAEYERTSEEYSHGIRSTPTMIINNRMVIGTFPYEQLRAIFQALVDEHEGGQGRFLENWEE
jgi:protein-disulfide isomerase/uncharacterized membrane protein